MAAITICSDFGAQEIKSVTVSIVSPSICHEAMGLDVMILVFRMLNFKPKQHKVYFIHVFSKERNLYYCYLIIV